MDYQFNSYNQFDTLNNYQIVYQGIGGSGQITEVLKTVSSSGNYQNIKYLHCGTSCDAATWSSPFPFLAFDTGRYTAAGQDAVGFKFTKASALPLEVQTIWYSGSNGGTLLQAQFGNGKLWTFSGMTIGSVSAGAFDTSTWGCPTPTCTVVADIVQVIDDSGSIGTSNFNNQVRPFAINICNSYDWAVNGAPGITMAGVFFSTDARNVFGWTTSKQSAINSFQTATYTAGSTCITCGIDNSIALFQSRPTSRQSVAKLVFFMTDGYHNWPPGTTFYAAADQSHSLGITTVAVGVGSAVSISQLTYISSTIPGLQTVYQVSDFAALSSIKNQLVGVTCTTFSGSPCGNGCQGFCACGATCVCPTCDTSNKCLVGSCTAGSLGTGCSYVPVNCDDGNACTTDTCSPSQGCIHTPVTCNSHDACIADGCNPASGCTQTNILARGDCNVADPCFAAACNSSATGVPNGCYTVPQACDSCKYPVQSGSRNVTKMCPDNMSNNVQEHDDGNKCKLWYCANNVTYSTTQYTPTPQTIGTCLYTMKNCNDNNVCTVDTCNSTNGNCVFTSISCDDQDPCTIDTCDPVTGCQHTLMNISQCWNATQPSQCLQYTLNSSIPTCCQVTNISVPLCGANLTDNCTSWRCLDYAGCLYFQRDCESEIGLDKLGDCQAAACTNQTGCYAELLTGKQVDKCGYCDGSTSKDDLCSQALGTSAIVGISAGILAAIIIAVIVICLICGAVGGKVGLDYYKKYKGKMNNLQSNPLYEEKNKGGTNPFYQEQEMGSK